MARLHPSRRAILLAAVTAPFWRFRRVGASAAECTTFAPAWALRAPDPGWERHARLATNYDGRSGPAPAILYDSRKFQAFDWQTGAPWTVAPVQFPAGAVVEQITTFGGEAYAVGSVNGGIYIARIPGGTGTAPFVVNESFLDRPGAARLIAPFDETRFLVMGSSGQEPNAHFIAPTRYRDVVSSWFLYPGSFLQPLAGCASPVDNYTIAVGRLGSKIVAYAYNDNLTPRSGNAALHDPATAERAQMLWHGDRCWFAYAQDDGYAFGQTSHRRPADAHSRVQRTGLADPSFAHTIAAISTGRGTERRLAVATGAGLDLFRIAKDGTGVTPECVALSGVHAASIQSITGIAGTLIVAGRDGAGFFVMRLTEAMDPPAPDQSGGAVIWAD